MASASTQSSSGPMPIVYAFLRGTSEMAADEARPIDGGCVLRAPSLPKVWSLNYLRLSALVTYSQRHAAAGHPPSARRRPR